jgi:hypothetical protein
LHALPPVCGPVYVVMCAADLSSRSGLSAARERRVTPPEGTSLAVRGDQSHAERVRQGGARERRERRVLRQAAGAQVSDWTFDHISGSTTAVPRREKSARHFPQT